MTHTEDDIQAIKAVIERQFAALSWSTENTGDWEAFAADFVDGAALFSAALSVKPQSVDEFLARMKNLAGKELRSLRETVLGSEIKVYGNIAVASVICGLIENEVTNNRTIEMLLLVKDDHVWRIAAQAWDKVSGLEPDP